MNSIA